MHITDPYELEAKVKEMNDVIKPILRNTPALAGSASISNDNMHTIESNSILIPDSYMFSSKCGVDPITGVEKE